VLLGVAMLRVAVPLRDVRALVDDFSHRSHSTVDRGGRSVATVWGEAALASCTAH
jgi:hypothetical protein